MSEKKLFNDPLYGFIEVPRGLILDLIDHPAFQRLRRISQLGLSHLVYPGALHTRFHHALGAMHLMQTALHSLREKGIKISDEEYEASLTAILLHDIGHGPFSHTLEFSLIPGISHEKMSVAIIRYLNKEFGGKLTLALQIFTNTYRRKFFHQLISSQLDMDRLDYLLRDSYFTGVAEGIVGSERIIRTLHVKNDTLVVEAKGVYSIEKFIIARRLMYWQVYLHKTVLAGQIVFKKLLERILKVHSHNEIGGMETIKFFLDLQVHAKKKQIKITDEIIEKFIMMDDMDMLASIKMWRNEPDRVISEFSERILARKLFRVVIHNAPFSKKTIQRFSEKFREKFPKDAQALTPYYISQGTLSNKAYALEDDAQIKVLLPDSRTTALIKNSDRLNMNLLLSNVKKYYLAYPKELGNIH